MKKFLGALMIATFVAWLSFRGVANIQFGRSCEGHLKRAADANTIELAVSELETAVSYMEDHQMTRGYTSILYTTPSEDIGFWHRNVMSALEELKRIVPESTSPLERSNVLMKLRETLLDQGDKSVKVTSPDGIDVYPHNVLVCILGWITALLALAGGWMIWDDIENG